MTYRVRFFILGITAWLSAACHHPPSPNNTAIADGSGPRSAGATLAGRVFDAASQDPVQGAVASLTPRGRPARSAEVASAVTDLAGNFVLNNLSWGDFDLRVTRTGYEAWTTHARVRNTGNQRYSVIIKRSISPCPRVVPGTKPIDCR